MRPRPFILSLLFAALASALPAEPVLAVLSGGQRPYQEALAGLKEALGLPVKVVTLPETPQPGSAKVVVAFGTEAALEAYPGLPLVYAMVPDLELRPPAARSGATRVEMLPAPEALAERLLAVHPGAKVLALFDVRGAYQEYLLAVALALRARGVQGLIQRVDSVEALPDALRALEGRIQGLWLPPSPLLLSPEAFNQARNYCAGHDLALFAPMVSLAKIGALAGIAPSFREMGRTAGLAAKRWLAGQQPDEPLYPQQVQVLFSAGVARRLGLSAAVAAKSGAVVLP